MTPGSSGGSFTNEAKALTRVGKGKLASVNRITTVGKRVTQVSEKKTQSHLMCERSSKRCC